jgi:hypothetical protein
MNWFDWLVFGSTAVPLAAALYANRSTSLLHAVVWTWLAWVGWGLALGSTAKAWIYAALGLTGCAGVAVFGARWPGAAAWNLVVCGLLAILGLPLAEGALFGTSVQLGTLRATFLAGMIGVIVINYCPTRLGVGALMLAVGAGREIYRLLVEVEDHHAGFKTAEVVLLAPWLAWGGVVFGRVRDAHSPRSAAERLWLSYKDRFGLVWGLRLREQFNRAANSSSLPVVLTWTRLRPTAGAAPPAEKDSPVYETLAALMKRFGLP